MVCEREGVGAIVLSLGDGGATVAATSDMP